MMLPVRHVVNFSGGMCSFWAAYRVVQQFGTENVVLLFADTLIEDAELYEFNEAAAAILGVPITRVSIGLDPWGLFRREGMIGNDRFPICSMYLKRKPLNEWIARNCKDLDEERQGAFWEDGRPPAILYVGFDWTEQHRVAAMRAELPQWQIEAPMTEGPLWDKCRMFAESEKLGLKIPMLYRLGFPHNNCGGRCVRAGITHWVQLYRLLPERFMEWMVEEQRTAQELRGRGIEPLSILKTKRGGVVSPLWLTDLKMRIESGELFPADEWGGCGCGGATQQQFYEVQL